MAHAQKPDFVFLRNGRVHLNRQGRQFSRLLAADVGLSAVVMLDTPCSEVVWRVLATHSIRQFPLNFPSRASPCAITFQLESTSNAPLRELKIPKLFIVLIISYCCKIIYIFIHLVVCLATSPKPLPKRALHIVQSRASCFKWQYPLLSLKSSSSCLRLLPRIHVTSIPPFIFPSITRCRRQLLRKIWPIQLAFRVLISRRIFLCSLILSNTSSFLTWYTYNVGKICLHIRIRITDLQKPVKVYHLRGQGQIIVESSLLPASAARLTREYLFLLSCCHLRGKCDGLLKEFRLD
jgi:hypothetical protein